MAVYGRPEDFCFFHFGSILLFMLNDKQKFSVKCLLLFGPAACYDLDLLRQPAFTLNLEPLLLWAYIEEVFPLLTHNLKAASFRIHNCWVLVEREKENSLRDVCAVQWIWRVVGSSVTSSWPFPGAPKGGSPPSPTWDMPKHVLVVYSSWPVFSTSSITWCLCAPCSIPLSWYPVTVSFLSSENSVE